MKRLLWSILVLAAMVGSAPQGQEASIVVRLDPALDELISSDVKQQIIRGYFGHVEGPLWVADGRGYLLFSDIAANRIYKVTPDDQVSVFMEKSGCTTCDPSTSGMQINNGMLEVIVLGSNGLTLDPQGRLVFGTHGDRAMKRREKGGAITVLADKYEGKRFSGPNDLVYRSDGTLYFSDVFGGLRGGQKSPLRELDFFGLYMLKDGKLTVVDKNPEGSFPNGVALSPDEKYLYGSAGDKIVRYEVQPDGMLTNRKVLVDMSKEGPGGPDGFKVDKKGNIWTGGPGGMWIVSPEGKHLGTVKIPTTNVAFGGADGKMLYIVGRGGSVSRIPVKVEGIRPMPKTFALN